MKSTAIKKILAATVLMGFTAMGMMAQNSLPAPGSGGVFNPAPAGGAPGPGTPPPPGPAWSGSAWGSPWYGFAPTYVTTPNPNIGNISVVACGFDSMGVWRRIPMRVHYVYNGFQYNVTVLSAWNPWVDVWNRGIDVPAVNTTYYLNGTTYNYYACLSTGTYYFNL